MSHQALSSIQVYTAASLYVVCLVLMQEPEGPFYTTAIAL